ncbi:uncharacterized protein LOC123031483 [Varanus komodoensis]|uniref:uncharacterized protein LOC123031483 n=1 Tax=Varanus komodoensis TaxID=61221 RepID=UPI001CF79CE0|nr:uncharacterized protein LOC123031483 [Varanus komodoensis]
MGVGSTDLQSTFLSLGTSGHGLVCYPCERGMRDVLLQGRHRTGISRGCPYDPVERYQFLRFLSNPILNESSLKDCSRRGHGNLDNSMVALSAVVFHSSADVRQHLSSSSIDSTSNNATKNGLSSGSCFSEPHSLANPLSIDTDLIPTTSQLSETHTYGTEALLTSSDPIDFASGSRTLHPDTQRILESALRPSMQKSYAAKWCRFSSFTDSHSFALESASIENILQGLLQLHHSGLKPSSIKVYTAVISYYRGAVQGSSVFSQPLIRRFIKGLQNLHPSI